MKARDILQRLTRRFGLVLLLTIVGGIAGAAYAAVKTPTYTAKAYVVAIGDTGSDPNTALNFAQAYGRVATSGPVLVKAKALLGSNSTGLDRVTASTSPDAPVIEIDATGPSAGHTADVANAVANALGDYGSGRKADTHVGLDLLAGATTPTAPTSPRPPLELLVGAAGGLLIGGLATLAGVGRTETRPAEPRPIEPRPVESVPGPPAQRDELTMSVPRPDYDEAAEIEGHLGVWRAQYGQRAITSYRSAAIPGTDDEDEDGPDAAADDEPVEEKEPQKVNGKVYPAPIVGRAAVAGMEDDD